MTNQNNAAQAAAQILTYLGFAQAVSMEPAADPRRDHIQALIESALLSKLRTEGVQAGEPVTDAQEAFVTWWSSQDEGSIQFDLEQYPQDLKASLNNLWNTAWRAGLASAPVAGEAQPVAWRALWTLPTPGVTAWYDTRKVAPPDEAEMRAKGYSLELAFAAPQASAEPLARYCPGCGSVGPVGDEYRDCCPDGNQARMIPARLAEKCRDTFRLAIQALLSDAAANDGAAPQASAEWILFEHEDGRMAAAPSADAAKFTVNDPAWHRFGPVTLMADAPQASEAVPMHRLAVAALNDLLLDIRAELGLSTTDEGRAILDTIRALNTQADKDGCANG